MNEVVSHDTLPIGSFVFEFLPAHAASVPFEGEKWYEVAVLREVRTGHKTVQIDLPSSLLFSPPQGFRVFVYTRSKLLHADSYWLHSITRTYMAFAFTNFKVRNPDKWHCEAVEFSRRIEVGLARLDNMLISPQEALNDDLEEVPIDVLVRVAALFNPDIHA